MTSILVTNLTIDEIFVQIQPDEKSRLEAIEWLKNQKSNENRIPIYPEKARKIC